MSFYQIYPGESTFVGFGNYERLFNKEFYTALGNSTQYTFWTLTQLINIFRFVVDVLSYILKDLDGKTHVSQCMEYEIKFGFIGSVMNKLIIRRKWNNGIKTFFKGLKQYIDEN